MAQFKYGDRVRETTSTVAAGGGAFILSGAVAKHQGFDAMAAAGGLANGDWFRYASEDAAGNWETGLGTYSTSSGRRIIRSFVAESSAGAGANAVFTTAPEVWISNIAADMQTLGPQQSRYVGTNTAVGAGATVTVPYDTQEENLGGMAPNATFDGVNYYFKPGELGYYEVNAQVVATTTFSGDSYLAIWNFPGELRRGPTLTGSKSLWLNAIVGPFGALPVELRFRVTSAGGGTIAAGASLSWAQVTWRRRQGGGSSSYGY